MLIGPSSISPENETINKIDPISVTDSDFEEFQKHIIANPEWFLRESLGLDPWRKEVEMIESVRDFMKTLVAGCVASGKTHGSAGLILWFLWAFAPSARVFCMAPTERQLKINLWGELPRMIDNARRPMGGELITLSYRFSPEWFAMGFSPKDSMGVFGIHGPHDLLLIDDAQGVMQEIWDALENALAGGTTKLLASCNPVVTSGEIYNALKMNPKKYNVIRIPAAETPNVMANKVVIPGMITKETMDRWIAEYGEDSDFVRTKIKAVLPKQEPDTLIPLDWIELARAREIPPGDHLTYIGVDVARFGDDDTVIISARGRQVNEPMTIHGNDNMQVAGHVKMAIENQRATAVFIDVIGVGAGVVDRLIEMQKQGMIKPSVRIEPVNVGEKANDSERFVNLRSEIWWMARESVDPKGEIPFALPNNDDLMAQLAAPKYSVDSSGRIKVETKEDMKKRLGRSPDLADAYCLAVFSRFLGQKKASVASIGGVTSFPGMPKYADWM